MHTLKTRLVLNYAFLVMLISGFCGSLCAQTTFTSSATNTQNAQEIKSVQPPRSLGDMLPQTYWNAEEKGVLMAISPERIVPKQKPNVPPITLPLAPLRGYNLTEILPFFDYRILPTGTVTAIAPTYMRVFTRPTIPAEEAVNYGKEEASAELFASFTKGQWEMAGSKDGIGLNDMTDKQKKLYAILLPEKAILYPRYRAPKPGEQPIQPAMPVTLTPQQIGQMRLRIAQKISLQYRIEGNGNSNISFGDDDEAQQGNYFLSEMPPDPEESTDPLIRKMYPKVLNHLKPSDLDYKSPRLNTEISLKNIKTVDDLVKIIGNSTSLILYADARVGRLPLYLRGDSARAGDLLQSLCVATLGTFRKLADNTFLLTESVEGLGTRMAAYQEWRQWVEALRSKRQEKRNEAMTKNGAQVPLDDPYGLDPKIKAKIRLGNYYNPEEESNGVETTQLPEALQKIVQKRAETKITVGESGGGTSERNVRTDKVFLQTQARGYFVLPGIGQFPANNMNSVSNIPNLNATPPAPISMPKPPAFTLPDIWKKRTLLATVTTTEEAIKIVTLARDNGFNGVWLSVPPLASRANPLLQAALKIARPSQIAIGIVISPLSVASELKAKETLPYVYDSTILGETSDVLAKHFANAPDSLRWQLQTNLSSQLIIAPTASNIDYLKKEIMQIASISGISSLLFMPSNISGYEKDSFWGIQSVTMGFHLENRKEFLQKESVDPIDLLNNSYEEPPLQIPYFYRGRYEYVMLPNGQYGQDPNNKDYSKAWRDFVSPQMSAVNASFYPALSQNKSGPALYTLLKNTDMIVPWTKPDMELKQMPAYVKEQDYNLAVAKAAQKVSPLLFRRISPLGNQEENEEMWQANLTYFASNDNNTPFLQGVLFDLSNQPIEKVTAYVATLRQVIQNAKK